MKTVKKIAQLIYILILTCCAIFAQQLSDESINKEGKVFFLDKGGNVIAAVDVKVADTEESREKGLMDKKLSDFSSGMLFVYQNVEPRTFWMRNTPSSLDIIFIGENSQVLKICRNTTPMSDKRCSSQFPVKYAVEVKAGFVEVFNIKEGTKFYWKKL